jgi:DNA-binding response OmpR family regulator
MQTDSDTILIVEDETAVADVVALFLQREGYQVRVARDGRQAEAALAERLPTLMILDINLPHRSGLEILRRLRQESLHRPLVIMLTDRGREPDRLYGLELGADDYVSKPFSTAELVARVKAILRRVKKGDGGERPLTYGSLSINPITRVVSINDQPKNLTATEFNLLHFLARHPRQIFTREQLLDSVWGYEKAIAADSVYVHMRRLRKKIEPDPANPVWLKTVWRQGYKFEPGELA